MKNWVISTFLSVALVVLTVVLTPGISPAQTRPGEWVEPPPAAPLPLPTAPSQKAQQPQKKQPPQRQQQRTQPSPSQEDLKELSQYTEKLRKDPADRELREKIIKHALSMKPAPTTPEEAERHIARGTAYLKKENDQAGYQKAITELTEAIAIAPWNTEAYYHLGEAQEKAGLPAEAIKSLNFYLLGKPSAKNARTVKNRIYALEVDVEASAKRGRGGADGSAPTTPLFTEQEKVPPVIKATDKNKVLLSVFEGMWHYHEKLRGESVDIHAFTIGKDSGGDLTAMPPDRGGDSEAVIPGFAISGRNLKVTITWKMRVPAGSWKSEQYDLTLSPDNKTLSGSYNLKTSKGKNAYLDLVLSRK